MTISLEGISLHVSDFEKSLAFYTQLPGVELVSQRPGEFARLKIGSGVLHLVQLPFSGFHIEIDTPNLETVHKELCASGFEPTTPEKHPWGKRDFKLVDPDGNQLEFGIFEGDQ